MQTLFNDKNRGISEEPNIKTGPSITTEELKKVKAVGPNEVYAYLLKLIEQNHLDIITKLLIYIYESGTIPDECLVSTIIPISKKISAKKMRKLQIH